MQDALPQRTIGITSLTLDGDYSGHVILGIQEVARQHGVQVIIFQGTPDDVLTTSALIDGWIVVVYADGLERLTDTGKPCITIAAVDAAQAASAVLTDNTGGVASAIDHLVEHGHQRIGFVGYRVSEDILQRHQGYQAALERHGIAYDPALVFDATDDEVPGGQHAAQQLIAAGVPCDAIFVATDENAMGLMAELQVQGYSIPDDLAVISFDNIELSQHTTPPLSTISQRPDMIGRTAALLLLKQLDGQVPLPSTYVPTALVLRRSCGCNSVSQSESLAPLDGKGAKQSWQQKLASALLRVALYPAPLLPDMDPKTVWPGVTTLIDGLEQIAQGGSGPSMIELAETWEQALRLTVDLEALHTIVRRLRRAAIAELKLKPDGAQWEALEDYLMRVQTEMVRVRLSGTMGQIDYLRDHVLRNYQVSMRLLGGGIGDATMLGWLKEQAGVTWSCLALWAERDEQPAQVIMAGAYHRDQDVSQLIGRRYPAAAFPPPELVATAPDGGRDHVMMVMPIRRHAGTLDESALSHFHHSKAKRGALVLYAPMDHQLSSNKLMMWSMFLSVALEREDLLISLAKAKEAAEEANRLKTQFVANMSHELRTPLNAILNFSFFLGDEEVGNSLNADQRDLQQRVLANADHLLGLINDILDLSKVEANRIEIAPEHADIAPLLQSVMSTAIGLTKGKPIDLRLSLPERGIPWLHYDKTRIRQVLLNLISNAAKFTEQGEITLSASLVDEDYLCVAVQDSGIGIPKEKSHLVFEPFRQVDGAMDRPQEGTGLGLAISKRLIELHGGSLWFESEPGVGTTFFFTLPLGDLPLPSPEEPPAEELAAPPRAPLVMIVDDSPDSQRILQQYLHGQGLRVEVVGDSRQAMAEIRRLQPELLILDVQMPFVSGWAILQELRKQRDTAHIPVIICSILDERRLAIALGAHGYLVKPVRKEELVKLLRRWVTPPASILLVDDNQDARLMITRSLAGQDLRIVEATNGVEALALLEHQQVDMVILDLLMPEMSGFEFLQRLRVTPEWQSLPVLILSAKQLTPEEHQWLSRAAQACMDKNQLSFDEFAQYVQAFLKEASESGSAASMQPDASEP